MQDLDQRDRDVLGALQSEVPLVSTPFAVIGQMIDMSEKEVIKRATRLKKDGVIRQITATFDGRALGYHSCLVAVRVPEPRIEQAASVIDAHPGVSQNYRRNHDFNLWFTIAVAPDSRLGLERTVALLADEAECEAARMFPTLRLLKNGSGDSLSDPVVEPGGQSTDPVRLPEREINVVRVLQGELPLQPRPFDLLARIAEIDPDELLAVARDLAARQQLRKMTALVDSRKPTFSASAMGVWEIEESRLDEFAARVAQNKAVSHCYVRPTYEDWPYNVFTTVHGRSVDECESVLRSIAGELRIDRMEALFPTREYKRARVTYFAPEFEVWESRHLGHAQSSVAS